MWFLKGEIDEMEGINMVIAVGGNPNSGKTTIFNALTGSKQHTGNWPGVTVEKKEGEFTYKGIRIKVIDLPGTYSLSSYSIDEKIARDYLVKEKPDFVVVVADASNLERNLHLFLQLKELGQDILLVLNMSDIAKSKGIRINRKKLSQILGIPIVETIGNRGKGIDKLKEAITNFVPQGITTPGYFGRKFISLIEKMVDILREDSILYPPYFVAIKILEEDPEFIKIIETSHSKEKLMNLIIGAEKLSNGDTSTFIAEKRFGYIHGVFEECIEKRITVKERIYLSDRIDKVVTNRFIGIPLFFFLLWLTFEAVFKLGNPVAGWISDYFSWTASHISLFLSAHNVSHISISFVKDGIIGGIGSILVFLPNIFILFFIIALFEDTGYMARAAFVMDKIMHSLGLHGKSFIPMVMGFGCNVPAIMATRALESKKDRILTILINPLMSCSARLPIYILFAGIFFAKYQGMVIFSLYFLGILLAVLVARVFKAIFFKGEVAPLVMELPPYHLPVFRNILLISWERTKMFLKRAGTIIFGAVILIWILSSLPIGVDYASPNSIIGHIGRIFAPIFRPAGFGFYQASVALIFGILAKEVVVGTLGTLFGGAAHLGTALQNYFNPASAYAFMVMSLIYIPCIASIAVIKKEAGTKWALFAVSYSLTLGWTMAVIFYQIGRLFL